MPSIWDSRLNNHPIWTELKAIQDTLRGVRMPEAADGADARARLAWIVEFLQGHRDTEEPRAYTPTMLDNVQRQLGNVAAHLNQYVTDPESQEASLVAAATHVDTVLDAMGNWPVLSPRGAAQAAGRAYADYAGAATAALATLGHQRDELAQQLTTIKADVARELDAIAVARRDLETNAATKLQEAVEEVSAEQLERTHGSVTAAQEAAETARADAASIAELRAQGNKIVAAVAEKVVADDYRRDARNKAIAGWVWDLIGMAAVGVPLAILLDHFLRDGKTDAGLTTPLALTRIGISLAALGLASLCFRRGHINHDESRRSKRVDLRIRTVRGFIANQDEEFQDALLDGMAERIYLRGILDEAQPEDRDTSGLLDRAVSQLRTRRIREGAEAE